MSTTKKLLLLWLISFALLLVLLSGCATPTRLQDVGSVVVAPQVKVPPPPALVQTTEARPVGFYQNSLLNFFSAKQKVPTK